MSKTITKEDKRNQIIKLSQELFVRFGYRKTTLEEIARYTGMRKSSLYYYFSCKEDIFTEVIKIASRDFKSNIIESLKNKNSLFERLNSYYVTKIRYIREFTSIYNILKEDVFENSPVAYKLRKEREHEEIELLKQILEESSKNEKFTSNDLDFTAQCISFFFSRAELEWAFEESIPNVEKKIERVVRLITEGLTAR